ncbi:hypothetical protein LIER_32127 [Lithospermum erythrorhizon]|uniref:Polyprotein n=1 Tax=Lithospermum erythrorhizon TaxID=34254 RepID=A0AAV3RTU5_LITER
MSLVVYYSKLKRLWDEFNELEPPTMFTYVSKASVMVSQVKKKGTMGTTMSFLEIADGNYAIYVKPFLDNNNKSYKKWKEKKNLQRCDHCDMRGHTKDTCFKLKGYPQGFANRNQKMRFQNTRNFNDNRNDSQRSYDVANVCK